MDGDVDMDAPQISTLSDEGVSPPPQAKSRLRVKLLVKEKSKSASAPAASSSNQKNPDEDEGDEDDEDQEDQLIDDDEPLKKDSEAGLSSSPKKKSTPNNKGPAATNAKTKPRKNLKRPPEEGRLREKVQQQPGAPNLSPTMLLFDAGTLGQPGGDVNYQEEELPSYSKGPPKKKQKKAPAPKEKKEKEKSASKIKVRLIPPQASSEPQDREDALSEAMTGTVASSPAVNPVEDASHASHSPEPEASFALPPPAVPPPQPEEINLDGVPIPVYPLPNKPFPVLPPPKVGSGLAPIIPLDRSGTKVRQWRVALREIRGIGGGRWFTRAWVGDKQSQFASEVKVNNEMRKALADSGVAIPKLPTMSISAPTGKGKGKAKAGTASSLSQSAAPSRAESLGPEGIPPPGASISTVRAPSKMRISQVPPPPSSEAGDSVSDMLGPPDV